MPTTTRRTALARDLRTHQTEPERILWQHLRDRRLGGLKFRRQRQIGRYIVDFCCEELSLIVEVDGPTHETPAGAEYDAERTLQLEELGYTVLRIPAETARTRPSAATAAIAAAIRLPPPENLGRG
jgi:uroporphyrinogen-III synthase